MKKFLLWILCAVLLLGTAGCTEKEDTSLCGTYPLYAMEYEGSILLADGLMEGSSSLLLKSGGVGELCVNGESATVGWSYDGSALTLKGADEDLAATIQDGIVTMTIDSSTLYFAAAGADTASLGAVSMEEYFYVEEPEPEPEPTEAQTVFNGWWYGGIALTDCTGSYSWLEGSCCDAMVYFEIGDADTGTAELYEPYGQLTADTEDGCFGVLNCSGTGTGIVCSDGQLFGADLSGDGLEFTLSEDGVLTAAQTFAKDEENGFRFTLTLQIWGSSWDGKEEYTEQLPGFADYISCLAEEAANSSETGE